ncbi:MAG: flagellar export chaperone FliS [Candidatus Ruminococcus intestinipullorum]|nr:flagellar export chaperone FliS [Candidatus Ruminococcus intestinipullorum]
MHNPYEAYKRQSVMTMTGGDMINLLFDTAIKRLNEGIQCIEQKDYEGCNTAFRKAQDIFTYLEASLDKKYEISGNLASLYEFFKHSILQANIKKETTQILEILPMIEELRDSFKQADKQTRMNRKESL